MQASEIQVLSYALHHNEHTTNRNNDNEVNVEGNTLHKGVCKRRSGIFWNHVMQHGPYQASMGKA